MVVQKDNDLRKEIRKNRERIDSEEAAKNKPWNYALVAWECGLWKEKTKQKYGPTQAPSWVARWE